MIPKAIRKNKFKQEGRFVNVCFVAPQLYMATPIIVSSVYLDFRIYEEIFKL